MSDLVCVLLFGIFPLALVILVACLWDGTIYTSESTMTIIERRGATETEEHE